MAHQFLHYLHVVARCSQQRAVGPPESVPANLLGDTDLPGCGLEYLHAKAVRPEWSFPEVVVAGEDPVLWLRIAPDRMPCPQTLDKNVIKRYRLLGDLSLAWADGSIGKGAEIVCRARSEVNILPPQSQHLSDPHTRGGADHAHEPFPFGERGQQKPELLGGQHIRPA